MKPYSLRSFVLSYDWNEEGFIIRKSYYFLLTRHSFVVSETEASVAGCFDSSTIVPGR